MKSISHYTILEKLGEGGMGTVYKAEDTKLRRKVALKFLRGDDDELRERFSREAQAAAGLSHPNICTVYEVDEEHGFLAMELVDGPPLKDKIAARPLPLEEALDIAIQIGQGLEAAHEKGIVHRDIKSANILLTPQGQVKITDFGLATLADRTRITKTGASLGTPAYMSPEQAQGKTTDRRTDIWSLGVVLYEMVSGRLPFRGESEVALLRGIADDQPEPLTGLRSGVPLALDRLVEKALAKSPADRYQHVEDMLVDLQAVRRRLESGASESVRRGRRRWRLASLSAGLVVLAALTIGLLDDRALKWWQDPAIDSLAVLPFASSGAGPVGGTDAEYLGDGIAESIIRNLSALPSLRVMSYSSVSRFRGQQGDVQEIGRRLKVQAVLAGRVTQRGTNFSISAELVAVSNNSQIWGDQFNRRVADVYEVQEEISREIASRLRLRLSSEDQRRLAKRYTENAEAYELYLKGRYHWNRRGLQGSKRAIEHFEQAIAKDPAYALAHAGLADCYNWLGWIGALSPREAFTKARSAGTRALAIDGMLTEAHTAAGFAKHFFDWDWSGAESEYRRSIEINPSYPVAHQWYSILLLSQGRVEEAIARAKTALELDPLSLVMNSRLGFNLYYARQYDAAFGQLQKTVDLEPNFPPARLWQGFVYEQEQKYALAIAEFQKAAKLFDGEPIALASLAHAYAVSGNHDEARRVLNQLLLLSQRRYVSAYVVALIHVGLSDHEQAWIWLNRAFEERSSWLTEHVKTDPRLDKLRSDPRFPKLLNSMRLAS